MPTASDIQGRSDLYSAGYSVTINSSKCWDFNILRMHTLQGGKHNREFLHSLLRIPHPTRLIWMLSEHAKGCWEKKLMKRLTCLPFGQDINYVSSCICIGRKSRQWLVRICFHSSNSYKISDLWYVEMLLYKTLYCRYLI